MKKYLSFLGVILLLAVAFRLGVFVGENENSPSVLGESSMPVPTLQATPTLVKPYPSQVINLTNWKITLPFGTVQEPSHPLEVKQPDLATYKIDPWFTITPDGTGIVFRAPVTGVTTGGSKYPRSELREMTDNGSKPAGWSSTKGKHTMFLDEAVTAVPKVKKQIVAGQIHDDNDDIIVIRLDYPNLYVNVNGKNVSTLDSHYTLGKRFTVKFVVIGGKTNVYYNGGDKPAYILNQSYSNSYFKTGVYTQSNCSKEKSSSLCSPDNYGEVVVYRAEVTHQ